MRSLLVAAAGQWQRSGVAIMLSSVRPAVLVALVLLFALVTPEARATSDNLEDLAAPSDNPRLLEVAWRALHPGQPSPARCDHPDPVDSLEADLDAWPGNETVLASLRFGVVLLAADGTALAWYPLGCVEGRGAAARSEVVSLKA